MAPEPATTRRKRTRLQDAQDETASSAAPIEPAAAVKKRKLNGATASSAPNGSSAVPSATRSSARATTAQRAGARTTAATKAPPKKGAATKAATGLVVPAVKIAKLPKAQTEKKSEPVRPAVKARALASQRGVNNIYDVPDSGDELELQTAEEQQGKANRSASRTKKQANGVSKSASNPGRSAVSKGKSAATEDEELEAKQPATKKVRGRPTKITEAEKADESDQLSDVVKPAVKQAKLNKSHQAWLQNSPSKGSPAPKGILTPRHKKAGRPRKNVAFDSGSKKPTEEVFFEDLPSTTKSAARPKSTKPTIKASKQPGDGVESKDDREQSPEDDEVCVICSKPDSEAPNEILFCEHCDKGFHQKCYGIPVIPEDDWFCKNCLQEDVLPGAQDSVQASGAPSAATERPDIPNFDHHLKSMQRVLLDRCSGSRRVRLRGQEDAYDKTYQLIEQTVLAGEGNSMMIIGARGCGKTLLVETIMSDLAAENTESFHVIRLSGFIHTDDKLALKEIWRQLGKEMEVEDDLNKTSNYADTLASLLALLSHPSEITGTDEGVTSKSVVFVIDEFDLFATHARQTLLYNLFDIAQARKAPIAVLGLTTRIDVVESLEKRVKSRFSHRYVHMSLPKSVPAFWDICRQGLVVEEEDLESEGFDMKLEGLEEFRRWWEGRIEVLRETGSFQDHLDYHFYTSKSVSSFFTSLIMPLSTLSPSSLDLKVLDTNLDSGSLEAPDSKQHLVAALSDLELAMLIAAARLDIVAHTDTVNFAMAYDEYSSQMGKQRVQSTGSGMLALGAGGRIWGRGIAGMAWERMASLGLLIPAGIGGRSNSAHGGLEGKMFKLDVVLEEIPGAVELPGFLTKWCTQI
ncbi:origin recognition complex subunit 4 [Apiospora rasikravindrae]|uniref:Origin recognition complex subunit 4 n=1 Tax=Apiospora rasikravindrae TaxID=990691 RepID=A0ABR1U189_9PEZI